MRVPFLNIDAGEYEGEPAELYPLAQAVSIACGGHAGDERSMERVLVACAKAGTRAGAHPSYEDREGFGRRERAVEPDALRASVEAQCARLARIARACGVEVAHIKAHGALYHAANRDPALARAVLAGAAAALGPVLVLGAPGGELQRAAESAGAPFAREGFADRAMRSDGSLVPRTEPGALITDVAAARIQAQRLARSAAFDTLCVHGDTPDALAIARAVRAALDDLGAGG
jgi:5-oxoprolinase (ATP-hydrolysing) subunit A